jgi:hypothetical protein
MYYPVVGFDEFGDGRFIALSDVSGTTISISDDDGAAWANVVLPAESVLVSGQDIGTNTIFTVAVGNHAAADPFPGSRYAFRTQDDGDTWETFQLPNINAVYGVSNDYQRVQWNQSLEKFIGCASNGGVSLLVFGDEQADNWALSGRIDAGGLAFGVAAAAYSPTLGSGQGRIVAIGSNGNSYSVRYSDDLGATWITGSGLPVNVPWREVIWDEELELYIAGRGLGSPNYFSATGAAWTAAADTSFALKIARHLNVLICTDEVGDDTVYATEDGDNYSVITIGGTVPYTAIAYNGRVWGMSGYAMPANFKNFAVATDPTVSWAEHINVMTTVNCKALTARYIGP